MPEPAIDTIDYVFVGVYRCIHSNDVPLLVSAKRRLSSNGRWTVQAHGAPLGARVHNTRRYEGAKQKDAITRLAGHANWTMASSEETIIVDAAVIQINLPVPGRVRCLGP